MSSVTVLAFALPFNARLWKIVATAKLAGQNINVQNMEFDVDNVTTDYLNNCHPLGRTPTLQTDEGYLFESNSILRYLARQDKANTGLYGRTVFEASQIDGWMDFVSTEIEQACATQLYVHLGYCKTTEERYTKSLTTIDEALTGLERWLETRTFLVGERMSIADVNIAFMLDWLFRFHPEGHEVFTKKFRSVFRLYNTVMNQPSIVEVFVANSIPIGLPKLEKKEQPKPVKEAKETKPDPAEDEAEDAPPREKKNPLDLLPPSKFVLDAFKREYSNKDTRKEAAPFLFNNFDKEGFSAYFCKYRYNAELGQSFMSSNLVGGWFQRMDGFRKYGFSSVVIAGTEESHEIFGVWIFRGKSMLDIVKDVDDVVLYEWTEIPDINAERERITDLLAWDGKTFEGKPCMDGRVFK